VGARATTPFGVSWIDDLRYCLAGGDITVAVDVGAHRGETARLILDAFPSAEVHAFEPVLPSFRALSTATQGSGVRCVHAAVSDADGTARFHLGPDSGRCGFRAPGPGFDVRTVTLDTYADECSLEHVDLLKIDAEGHEVMVLRGATGLLSSGRVDYVLAECEFVERGDEPHGDFSEILRILTPFGYRVVSFYTGGVDDHGWRWGDVLFRRVSACGSGWVAVSPTTPPPRGT
jgi:FkbM family methyltransferase